MQKDFDRAARARTSTRSCVWAWRGVGRSAWCKRKLGAVSTRGLAAADGQDTVNQEAKTPRSSPAEQPASFRISELLSGSARKRLHPLRRKGEIGAAAPIRGAAQIRGVALDPTADTSAHGKRQGVQVSRAGYSRGGIAAGPKRGSVGGRLFSDGRPKLQVLPSPRQWRTTSGRCGIETRILRHEPLSQRRRVRFSARTLWCARR